MARDKRTKPCSSCKKSKVRCIYADSLPCERCVKIGRASACTFAPKLPNLTLPVISKDPSHYVAPRGPADMVLPPLRPLYGSAQPMALAAFPAQVAASQSVSPVTIKTSLQPPPPPPMLGDRAGNVWKNAMENRMDSFDSKLNDLADILKTNQRYLMQNERRQHQQTHSHTSKRWLEDDHEYPHKRGNPTPSEDFRNTVLTLEQARELFAFFDANITQQLFGFEISKISVDTIWISSPLLVCALCTIAAMHHPAAELASKQSTLQSHLHTLCGDLVYKGRPKTEVEGFNTILALVCCSFWLSDSQMFTGLALQIAKEVGLDKPVPRGKKGALSQKDRLKLWYLIYILDGQQSITFNRRPLVNSHEYSLQHSKTLLLKNKTLATSSSEMKRLDSSDASPEIEKDEQQAKENRETFTDLRLVSQVEYNQAISSAFDGDAWELLAPSSFGIPSKSNLDLDKWMVSWTVLLSPIHKGGVWSSKSTLIYYNFAKMHINSAAMRRLQIAQDSDRVLPTLSELDQRSNETTYGPEVQSSESTPPPEADWEDSSDDEDEFIKFGELTQDDPNVSTSIALNAAQTVLNLVLNDKDIAGNLKYVPVHIHIMLYYASMLLLSPEAGAHVKDEAYFRKVINNLVTVVSLKELLEQNFPVDKQFGTKLLRSMQELIEEKTDRIKKSLNEEPLPREVKIKLFEQLRAISTADTSKIQLFDESSRSSSPGAISAWPGSNHGHP